MLVFARCYTTSNTSQCYPHYCFYGFKFLRQVFFLNTFSSKLNSIRLFKNTSKMSCLQTKRGGRRGGREGGRDEIIWVNLQKTYSKFKRVLRSFKLRVIDVLNTQRAQHFSFPQKSLHKTVNYPQISWIYNSISRRESSFLRMNLIFSKKTIFFKSQAKSKNCLLYGNENRFIGETIK